LGRRVPPGGCTLSAPAWRTARGLPSAALLDPSAPALSLNTAPIPPIHIRHSGVHPALESMVMSPSGQRRAYHYRREAPQIKVPTQYRAPNSCSLKWRVDFMIRLSLMTMCLILLTPSLGRGEPTNEIRGLLMRFDEPIGMRFTDYSGSGHTITPVGGVSHSRSERIAGAGSACFDGTGYLRLEASPDFHFQGDLTIDFWFKSTSTMRQHALSFGSLTYPQTNLDFNFADTDIAAPTGPVGFWLYWNSSGSNMIVSGTRLQYMDGIGTT